MVRYKYTEWYVPADAHYLFYYTGYQGSRLQVEDQRKHTEVLTKSCFIYTVLYQPESVFAQLDICAEQTSMVLFERMKSYTLHDEDKSRCVRNANLSLCIKYHVCTNIQKLFVYIVIKYSVKGHHSNL